MSTGSRGHAARDAAPTYARLRLPVALLRLCSPAPHLRAFVADPANAALRVLEVNEAGTLTPELRRLPGHVLAQYPAVDMHALPYPDASFHVVVHSDTLEHVAQPERALAECRRVLIPGGALCFTIPVIVGRMSRSREGLPVSRHGGPVIGSEVRTEFGADMWTYVLRAGFSTLTLNAVDYPAGLAITAWR